MTSFPESIEGVPSMPRRAILGQIFRFCLTQGVNLVFAGALAALLVHWTVRDSWRFVAPFFYMTPPPLIFAATTLCSLSYFVLKKWRRARFAGVIALCMLPVCVWVDWAHHPRPGQLEDEQSPPVRVMFWNVARKADLTETFLKIREQEADLVGLVELTGNPQRRRQQMQESLPGYDISVLGGNMYLLSKWPSGATAAATLHHGSEVRQLAVAIRGMTLNVIVADIDSYVIRPRAAPLKHLREFAEPLLQEPTLIMGDFNTPIDSVHFEQFRPLMKNLFEVAGNGYGPTWPFPLPVLQLDQMWVSEQIIPLNCIHLGSMLSDHRAVVGEILLPKKAAPAN